jgi:UDP-N-acetyl-D-mannosaminouronate:lipid I N-acetyl-D-mannosaminouronosyltransferase
MINNNVCFINNIAVYPFKNDLEILDYIDNKKAILVAVNALKIVNADNAMRDIVNSHIGYADGSGVALALKRKGCKDVAKIPGCELWLKIVERRYRDKSFYLLGSKQEILEATTEKLNADYSGIRIVGHHNGYFDNAEKTTIIQDIIEKKPDIIFVAIGSPKQELLMAELYSHYPALYQGLGGSFDIYTNHVNRAPQWMIDHNLEWAWRLLKQPGRIFRQLYLVKYLFCVITGKY